MTGGFDHLAEGTAESAWSNDLELSRRPRLAGPDAGTHLLVVAAHPDDETLGAGGLIAMAAAAGADVDVIVASRGEASHPQSPTHSAADLAAMRAIEVHEAVRALDARANVELLDLPDGRLDEHESALAAAIERKLCSNTLLVTTWSADRHPDHEACARVGARQARRRGTTHWQFPIWLWHWGVPGACELPASLWALDLDGDAMAAKRAAMQCYPSQHQPLSAHAGDEAILPRRLLEHFERSYETFVVSEQA